MSEKKFDRTRALRPLATRDYRLLFAAVGIEVFGTGMWTIVMVFQVLALDDSPLALSAVATGMSLGLFAFSVLGGVVADRLSKRRIIITVQGCTAAVMTAVPSLDVLACTDLRTRSAVATGMSLGLFAFSILGGVVADRFSKRRIIITVQGCTAVVMGMVAVLSLTGTIELWHVGVASFAMGAGSAFFYPAYSAYLPEVLPAEQLLAANGLEGALRPSMGQGLGPALGGIVVGLFFPAIGAAIVAGSYLVAFVITLFLSHRDEPVRGTSPEERASIWGDLRAGVRYVSRTRWLLWTLIFGSSLALIIQGPIEVLLPFLTRDRFEDAEATFGFLLAAYGIGGAVGSLVVSSLFSLP